jgi:hypothetical protein
MAEGEAAMKSRIKQAIIRLALCGVLPIVLADFLIRHGGLRHE